MGQGRLFRLTIRRTEPAPFGSADCGSIGIGDDGLVYVLKRVQDAHPLVPATEWICTRLAQDIGLPVAPCHIAELPGTGELAFASREEGGVLDKASAVAMLKAPGQLPKFTTQLARWYAYDLFTHNVDRHVGNFLFRQSIFGHVLIGIDFSRALLTQDWPNPRPPLPACNTVHVQRVLHGQHPYPAADAVGLIDKLGTVTDDWLSLTLCDVPVTWLDATVKHRITRWWRRSRHKRLRLLRKHLDSGRYLRVLANPRSP